MTPPGTFDELVDLVRKAQLVSPDRLEDYLGRNPRLPSAAPKLCADHLVRDGLLTEFQAEQLLLGKFKGFDLGKYRLLERIGSGGMGQVYLAQHQIMNRPVALKVLPRSQCEDSEAIARFLREARAAGALTHPNIVRAYDVDSALGMHFLVMEYVDGCSLQQLVAAHGPLPTQRAAYYLWQAAVGLQHTHEMGLVHRDIKPANVLLDRLGVIKLLDLGLARFFQDGEDALTRSEKIHGIIGTADYLSPEQAVDSTVADIRSDIYSLGATAYFLLTGQPPFPIGRTSQKLIAHQTQEPTPIPQLKSGVSDALVSVIHRMMRKRPEERYQTPAEIVVALDRWAQDPPPPPRPEEMPKRCKAASGPQTPQPSATLSRSTLAARQSSLYLPLKHPQLREAPRLSPLMLCVLFALSIGGAIWWAGWLESKFQSARQGSPPAGASERESG